MIDFHTHILPGIDDGSRDIGMTGEMLREEKRQGVDLIVATPHFYANQMSMEAFLSNRAAAMESVEGLRRDAGEPLPEIVAGAEVYYFRGMGRAEAVKKLCIDRTRTILLEMPFEQWNEGVLRDVEDIIDHLKLNVVLAHIERYYGLQKDKRVWDRVLALPLIPQINAGSFAKKGGLFRLDRKRRFCMGFLAEHPNMIVGSDCHNPDGRPPNMARAWSEIRAELGEGALKRIEATARKSLGLG